MAGNDVGLGSLVPGGAGGRGAAWGQGRDVAALLRPTQLHGQEWSLRRGSLLSLKAVFFTYRLVLIQNTDSWALPQNHAL